MPFLPFKRSHSCSVIAASQTTAWMCQCLACIPAAPSWASSSLLFLVPTRCVRCCTCCLSCVDCSGSPHGSNPCSDLLLSSCVSFLHFSLLPQSLYLFLYQSFLTCLVAWVAQYAWSVACGSACHSGISTEHSDSSILHVIHVGGPWEVAEESVGFLCPVSGVWKSGILSRLRQWCRQRKRELSLWHWHPLLWQMSLFLQLEGSSERVPWAGCPMLRELTGALGSPWQASPFHLIAKSVTQTAWSEDCFYMKLSVALHLLTDLRMWN